MSQEPETAGSHESRSGTIIAVISGFTFLIVLTAALRLLAKAIARSKYTVDDLFVLITTVLNLVSNACDIKACLSGLGKHGRSLDPEDEINALKYGQLAVGLAGIAYWAAKMSICAFILQIIRGTIHKRFRICIYALMGLVTASSFISLLIWGLQAQPFPRAWDPRVPGTSQDPKIFLAAVYFNYAMNIFINLLYALSPIYFLKNVQMDMRKKAIIFALIGSSLLIIVISSLNIVYAPDFLDRSDPTWILVNEFLCDIVERNFTVVVANLPGLWMLLGQIRKRSVPSRGRNTACSHTTSRTNGGSGLLQSSMNLHGQKLPLSKSARTNLGGRKDPWRRAIEADNIDDDFLLREVSAARSEPCTETVSGGINVRTEIIISEESRAEAGPVSLC